VNGVVQTDYNKINYGWCRADEKLQNKRAETHFLKKNRIRCELA
jgi:hypothetical protein